MIVKHPIGLFVALMFLMDASFMYWVKGWHYSCVVMTLAAMLMWSASWEKDSGS